MRNLVKQSIEKYANDSLPNYLGFYKVKTLDELSNEDLLDLLETLIGDSYV